MELLRGAPQVPPLLLETEGDPHRSPEFEKKLPGMMQSAYRKLGVLEG